MNSQLIRKVRKVPDAGKYGEQKRVSEDDMAGWHCQCNGLELGQTLGDGERQSDLACYSSRGCKELNMTCLGESFQ